MRVAATIALAMAGLAGISPAFAADQEPVIRCLTATSALAGSEDKDVAQIGLLNSVFWLGRLDPAFSEAELEKRMAALSSQLAGESLQAELKRCGTEMAERGAMMQRVGKKLQERATKADTH